ncbi:nucleotidyltransferase domain-containing protein [Pyrolobus fumarii]|uniref:nucleotidyltransferase domain-containing protein n=1 Tax=Pyrolobus fumarii TaxID=54252 RepID=UPI000AEFE885|nr:nucleotidyltransferase domain-containing protein [Pyrolobus fumarii]
MDSRLKLLREWKKVVQVFASIVKMLYPESEVYLFGGAAEKRLTVLSDIDVMVVLRERVTPEKRVEVIARIWETLEKAGIPPYYPLEIHVVDPKTLEEYKRRGAKLIKLA